MLIICADRIFWTTKAGAGDRRPAGLCSPGEALRSLLVCYSGLAHSSAPPKKTDSQLSRRAASCAPASAVERAIGLALTHSRRASAGRRRLLWAGGPVISVSLARGGEGTTKTT